MYRVASIHWGFSIGGVGKYASIIDKINKNSDIEIYNIIILSPKVHVDQATMNTLKNVEVIVPMVAASTFGCFLQVDYKK